jgi:hypothetical protein
MKAMNRWNEDEFKETSSLAFASELEVDSATQKEWVLVAFIIYFDCLGNPVALRRFFLIPHGP